MRDHRPIRIALLGFAVMFALFSACRTSQPARYYVLTAAAGSGGGAAGGPTIGLGPFTLPDYLNRPQIVTRKSDTELHLSESNRWAEPLPESFLTALVDSVAQHTESERVLGFPWSGRPDLECRVRGEVIRFEADSRGEAVLDVRWLVTSGSEDPGEARRGRYRRSATPGDYASIAGALSQTVSLFGADVVAACQRAVEDLRQPEASDS